MDPQVASNIVALRPLMEELIVKAASDPEIVTRLPMNDQKLVDTIRNLCKRQSGKFGMKQEEE